MATLAITQQNVDHNLNDVDVEKQSIAPPVADEEQQQLDLEEIRSHASLPDMPNLFAQLEVDEEIYHRFTPHRKMIITAILSFCGLLAPLSSTAILSATPEVAAEYNTNGSIINLSNGLYLVFMGFSPILWGPMSQVYGRRWIYVASVTLFFVFCAATALAPNLAAFFIFRMLTAFEGTSLLVIGSSVIGDVYKPTERATALGWFLSGTLIGPAFGPFLGGIIVAFRSWRDIFWLQTALGGFAAVSVFICLPETIHRKRSEDLKDLSRKNQAHKMWEWMNPLRVIRLFRYPNLLLAAVATGSLVWNMYSLLTPIRYVINPRFHLTSSLDSGLFYLAPGSGYLLGTFFGGRWADHVVKKWIRRRGERIPEDRLRSVLFSMGVVVPGCMLIYGWSIEKKKGGIALPIIVMFAQGFAQLMAFPSLNTYCLDVMPGRGAEVIGGNYIIRYFFAALGSAVCLPAIEKIGVGWFSTISALFAVVSTSGIYTNILFGKKMRNAVDVRKNLKEGASHSIELRKK